MFMLEINSPEKQGYFQLTEVSSIIKDKNKIIIRSKNNDYIEFNYNTKQGATKEFNKIKIKKGEKL